ncbi:penicillin-binding protein 2 [Sulfurivirga caldicuralii]|uniref:Peptidoglycan D,D-transpeptidase MrdA n=1 Tax=Sulfurivirga caldicuralii TaxID=364032 RepID=A0A1N6EKJ5_9GAMM|nr:penicillin-binding protein 2 [Sulfurivirga caldicuralii]SIN83495.1 penicillin-binding protein 2 [Sulfurivirga caldicuralii]
MKSTQAALLFKRRIIWAALAVLVGFGVLLGRMAYLQITLYDRYASLAEGNRISVEVIPPRRGRIFDRNHVVLADNRPTFVITAIPERTRDLRKALQDLSEQFPYKFDQNDADAFYEYLRVRKRFKAYPLPFDLDETEAARFAALSHQWPGFELTTRLKRIYPYGSITAHVVGYVGKINEDELKHLDAKRYQETYTIGKSGIEKQYENLLMGHPGYREVERNAQGRIVRVLNTTPPQDGEDITLTLDIALQQKAYKLLGGRPGAIVALKPEDGSVLAIASAPGFDANLFVDGIDASTYHSLLTDWRKPLINRPIAGVYPPGSTIKPFLGLIALEHGIVSPGFNIYDPGYFEYQGHTYRDWKREGHGRVDLYHAIMESCDTYFYQVGLKMGIDRIHDGLLQFGLGRKTGIDLPGERSGLIPNKAWKRAVRGKPWYNGETIIAAIGQGYDLSTPIQLARATAILANRGTQVVPHLRDVPVPPEGHIPIKNRKHWELVIKAMVGVLKDPRHGTARRAGRMIPIPMAGKTGTAQVKGLRAEEEYDETKIPLQERDHALFIGFAPVDKPEIAVSVIVEHGGGGSKAAAPLAVQLVNAYLGLSPPKAKAKKP